MVKLIKNNTWERVKRLAKLWWSVTSLNMSFFTDSFQGFSLQLETSYITQKQWLRGALGILKCTVSMWLLPIPEHLPAEHLFLNNASGRLFFFFQGFRFFFILNNYNPSTNPFFISCWAFALYMSIFKTTFFFSLTWHIKTYPSSVSTYVKTTINNINKTLTIM